ncbi:cleft lip and palate transmembrane 1 protein [Coccidioides immitis H538.4]|uniref:Cleft lip and palate transmembrane 1 protein n=1 Tax=Coccidioides immitis H538.4 TaxID=396776 RepID=A0A0J8S3E6_COCIT|nr:cleft lip and palate transmembrane 1 protein [Coccidioides immitis H538.4]
MSERRPQPREESSTSLALKSELQGLTIFALSHFVIQRIFPSKQAANASGGRSGIASWADRPDQSTIINATPYLIIPSLKKVPKDIKVLEEKNFTVGDWNENREIATEIFVPKAVQNNGTLWAHFYVALSGHQLDPSEKDYNPETAYHFVRPLNQYLPKKKVKKLRNLLDAKNETEPEEEAPKKVEFGSFYHPNVSLSLIPDSGTLNYQVMHPGVRQFVQLERTGARDASGQNGWYYPIIFVNTFWQLRGHMIELNSTVETLPIRISLNNLKNWKFSIYASVDENMKQTQRQAALGGPMPAGSDGSEFEMVKEILLDTNAYLLATTGIVSVLHMIFEGLAFKNDISHWRKKKDVVGTSLRTILANIFMQGVIFLYLLDNSEGTSWMILAGQGFGVALEAWKITKTVNVRIRRPSSGSRFAFLPYHVVFEDKHTLSETEKKTKEYDEIAFKWLYIIAVPLLIGYAIYSLVYETHKSWYSFLIETLVGSVYAYGFLMMVPSLYINYRLKSVAHMPGKALMYKFLNTFIDDLFAFTIKMPTLHRLATLRDDVIFSSGCTRVGNTKLTISESTSSVRAEKRMKLKRRRRRRRKRNRMVVQPTRGTSLHLRLPPQRPHPLNPSRQRARLGEESDGE